MSQEEQVETLMSKIPQGAKLPKHIKTPRWKHKNGVDFFTYPGQTQLVGYSIFTYIDLVNCYGKLV